MKINKKEKESLINDMYAKLSENEVEKGFPVLAATIDKNTNTNIVIQNKRSCNGTNTDINNHAEIILLKEIEAKKLNIEFILISLPPCFNCFEKMKEYVKKNKIKIFFLVDVRNKKNERKYLRENDDISFFKWKELEKNIDFTLKINFIIMNCIFGFFNHKKPAKNIKKILKFTKEEFKKFKNVIDKLKIKKNNNINDEQLSNMVEKTRKIKLKNMTIKNIKKDDEFYWIIKK